MACVLGSPASTTRPPFNSTRHRPQHYKHPAQLLLLGEISGASPLDDIFTNKAGETNYLTVNDFLEARVRNLPLQPCKRVTLCRS